MQQVAKFNWRMPAAAALAPILLPHISWISNAICQHCNVVPHIVYYTLVPIDETQAVARERQHQELWEQVGFSP